MVVFALNPSSSTTACTDWTSTADIPASIANGSACDYVDGGTYTLDVRGTDPDCSDAVTTTATDFTWNAAYTPIASFRMEQASWDGTVGEVIDSMGNYHGTARGNSNLPMTTNADPAIGGDPGTCTYGEFDDSDDYIEIPGFPDLTSDFTITAWIRTRNNAASGQRIFADDENNAGGYALSLGDPGAGRLRFYSRAASPVSMDTGNIIANDTWYFVAGVADIVNKTRTIYIYDTSFTQLASVTGSYTGSWGTDTGMASIGGETNSGETANRFDGNLDEVRIYTSAIPQAGIEQIMRETHSCPVLATVDHYEIHHDGVALTCQPEDVIVYACENADCSSQYAGSTNVTMSPAGWVGGDSKSFTDNDTFQLRHTTAEAVTLGISSSNPNADVSCYQGGAPASCTLTFYDAGFLFDVPTQTACRISSALTISAVRLDVTSQQCIPAFANRTENINFWSTYEDPATGTENISVSGTPVATSSPGTAVPLTFNASGESTFTVQYDDAGELRLDAGFTGSGAEAGLMMAGNDSFVAAPAGLCVYADEATADCGSGDGTCTAFTRAGQDFNLKVKGVCWETSGEADADFCDNPTTPNFQLSSIALSHSLVAPGTGVSGSIGVSGFDMIAGDNGEHTISNQTVNEVGVFTFTADPPDYLGAGDIIPASTSANIGRFIPDHFSVSINPDPPTLANSCLAGAFTYLGKNFTYAGNPQITITAQNTANTTTHNYEGGFWKLGEPFILNYTYADSAAPVALSPAGSSASSAAGDTADCNGTLTVTLTDSFSYARPAATSPVAPFAGSVDLSVAPAEFTDTDTVCSDSGSGCQGLTRNAITGISLRHGRIKVKDNFGPKNEDISPSPFQIQFWDDFDADAVYEWETNTDENAATCTTEPTLGFCTDNAGHSIAIDAGSLLAGAGTVTVGHDVLETARTVRVCPTTPAELTSLTGCGSANDKCGNLTFGIYRGNDRIINWLEILR
jgi:MSHA biogenesis protein MshQ